MALADSLKRHNPKAIFVLCLVEREVPKLASDFEHFDHVVLAKDAGWENFDSFMFRHSIVEASTAVKPRFMQYLMERFTESGKFVYLDPDVLVYGEFVELEALLDKHSIVVAPHLLRPGNVDMEISSLAHGSYNLGFLAVSRSANSEKFVGWWAERLFLFCYDDKVRGIFTDQKWIDLAPSFFDVHILKHHGYDFATWSLLGSDLREQDGAYVVNGDPLRFIHFSGLDSGTIEKAIGWWLEDGNKGVFCKLFEEYKSTLDRFGQKEYGRLPWSYNAYGSGAPIKKSVRVLYRDPALWSSIPSPFDSSDAQISEAAGGADSAKADGVVVGEDAALQARYPRAKSAPPTIVDRFARSILDIGFGASVAKSLKVLVGK
ncbi:hypothetical protein ATCM_17225 [Stenotrophomonas sp. ATCM1_4]|uniref:hypothetical protein n=1 Tax=Stenotrophomonas sp. ATCM1_4 TaxID=2259330 RepID=UPI00104D46B2|nr:hypothetical protein [Stenotrophomonas sp. ATCM1_4]TDB29243.1 hypothetical protein ATCM_17225 [Stenotrophomonas sp. ATCM1_4]